MNERMNKIKRKIKLKKKKGTMKVVDSTKCYHENLMSFANLPEMHYFIIPVSIG